MEQTNLCCLSSHMYTLIYLMFLCQFFWIVHNKSNPGGMLVIEECKLIFSKERHCPRPNYIHLNILVVSFC